MNVISLLDDSRHFSLINFKMSWRHIENLKRLLTIFRGKKSYDWKNFFFQRIRTFRINCTLWILNDVPFLRKNIRFPPFSSFYLRKYTKVFFSIHQLNKAFNPIPAGGGGSIWPPCSFFYITRKVLVWGCWNFLTFPTYPKPSL